MFICLAIICAIHAYVCKGFIGFNCSFWRFNVLDVYVVDEECCNTVIVVVTFFASTQLM